MTEKDILELKKDNYIPIHLYLAGIFRCACGRSIKLFLLLVLFGVDLLAQTVTEETGYPVIDLSALAPLRGILTSKEASVRREMMNLQIPSNSTYLSVGSTTSDVKGEWNAKMSGKFQVMCADHTSGVSNWEAAYTACKEYNGESGGSGLWRLPTQRELQMIFVLHPQLIDKRGFIAFSANNFYWSITESSGKEAYFISFAGQIPDYYKYDKVSQFFFRCVRDL